MGGLLGPGYRLLVPGGLRGLGDGKEPEESHGAGVAHWRVDLMSWLSLSERHFLLGSKRSLRPGINRPRTG
jgi:hypothetical protein